MRTSKALLAGAVLALSACDGGFELGGVTRKAPERIRLADGMVVAGADGWCIDTSTSRARADTAVVVLGSCAAIAGNALAPRPDVPGVVTVSVDSDGVGPGAEELEGFFNTEAGRAALARDGRAESVEILETRREADLLYLRSADQSAAPGTARETWRALFDLDGNFVSVSLFGLVGDPINRDEGLETVSRQVSELRAANHR